MRMDVLQDSYPARGIGAFMQFECLKEAAEGEEDDGGREEDADVQMKLPS
jgi:hypothetical protein